MLCVLVHAAAAALCQATLSHSRQLLRRAGQHQALQLVQRDAKVAVAHVAVGYREWRGGREGGEGLAQRLKTQGSAGRRKRRHSSLAQPVRLMGVSIARCTLVPALPDVVEHHHPLLLERGGQEEACRGGQGRRESTPSIRSRHMD